MSNNDTDHELDAALKLLLENPAHPRVRAVSIPVTNNKQQNLTPFSLLLQAFMNHPGRVRGSGSAPPSRSASPYLGLGQPNILSTIAELDGAIKPVPDFGPAITLCEKLDAEGKRHLKEDSEALKLVTKRKLEEYDQRDEAKGEIVKAKTNRYVKKEAFKDAESEVKIAEARFDRLDAKVGATIKEEKSLVTACQNSENTIEMVAKGSKAASDAHGKGEEAFQTTTAMDHRNLAQVEFGTKVLWPISHLKHVKREGGSGPFRFELYDFIRKLVQGGIKKNPLAKDLTIRYGHDESAEDAYKILIVLLELETDPEAPDSKKRKLHH